MTTAEAATPAPLAVPVRELCEFTAKRGDLDLRFTPSPTALEGVEGHSTVTARRGAGYRREVAVEGDHRGLRIRGRADGFDESRGLVEEIKTYRGDLARMPANHRSLHWAQLKVYGALICREKRCPALTLRLTYFHVDTREETSFDEECSADELEGFLGANAEAFVRWAASERAHRQQRTTALAALVFPRPAFNPGQRELAAQVFRAARDSRSLLVEAPTGIGKTLGTVFPALKAMVPDRIDKLFYLTARTSGRQLALDALADLRAGEAPVPLRVLELTAREKCCVHPEKACHGESCPLAKGFFDRLPQARADAAAAPEMTQPELARIAQAHQVCPYFLSIEMIRWADVVVGDYNYWFDQSAALHGLTRLNEWKVVVLVDETHNLVDRARGMYSAELRPEPFERLRRSESGTVRRALQRLNRAWNAVHRDRPEAEVVDHALPAGFLDVLRKTAASLGEAINERPPESSRELREAFLDCVSWLTLGERFSETHSLFVRTRDPGHGRMRTRLAIRNVVPAPFLAERHAAAQASVFFSATLGPPDDFCELAGVERGKTAVVGIPSPFRAEQLEVRVFDRISTRWADRERSAGEIAAVIRRQFRRRPGNYLVFASSYAYLAAIHAEVAALDPAIPCWPQTRDMSEADRTAFLARFEVDGSGLGFCVLGGVFGEGIDLPGSRLVGAFIATLGLPQVNAVTEAMKACVERSFGRERGFESIYLNPGLRRVVQAAGRVIRTLDDRGSVFLLDERYRRAEVRSRLPAWWRPQFAESTVAEPRSELP